MDCPSQRRRQRQQDVQNNNNHHHPAVTVTNGEMMDLLITHGANPLETDVRDISLLHWAAGCGNLNALEVLAQAAFPPITTTTNTTTATTGEGGGGIVKAAMQLRAERDGASILHWAAAGANPKEFGCGGHIDVCRAILSPHRHCATDNTSDLNNTTTTTTINTTTTTTTTNLVNAQTKDGNSVVMWAAWSGSLDVVQLLFHHYHADVLVRNRNGCTIAHWAASGGNLDVCRYLSEVGCVEFEDVVNDAGNSPLDHAVAYGRVDVVRWILGRMKEQGRSVKGGGVVESGDSSSSSSSSSSSRAYDLALNFVEWDSGGDGKQRRKVFDLFSDGENIRVT